MGPWKPRNPKSDLRFGFSDPKLLYDQVCRLGSEEKTKKKLKKIITNLIGGRTDRQTDRNDAHNRAFSFLKNALKTVMRQSSNVYIK